MHETKRRFLLTALKFLDLALLVASFGLATILVVHADRTLPLSAFLSMRVKLWNFSIFAGLLYVWHVLFASCGLYHSRRVSSRRADLIDIGRATALSALFLGMVTLVFEIRMVKGPVPNSFLAVEFCARGHCPHGIEDISNFC